MTKTSIEIKKEGEGVLINIQNLGFASKREDNGEWTVYCPSLKVIGYSRKSYNAAFKDFEENLSLFFTVHIQDKTIDRALLSFNYTKRTPSVNESLKASNSKKLVSPKIQFTNKTNSESLKTSDFKVPVLDLAA